MAAGLSYGWRGRQIDLNFAVPDMTADMHPPMLAAAAFVRQWPDAPAEALPIHLGRKYGAPLPAGRRELAAWKVFAFTLKELDRCDREEADEAAAKQPAPATGGYPLEQALKPSDPGFAPTGYSAT